MNNMAASSGGRFLIYKNQNRKFLPLQFKKRLPHPLSKVILK